MKVELLSKTPDAEKIIAAAAKLCYSKTGISEVTDSLDDKKIRYYIDMLTEIGHESTLEHAVFTFGIEGVSRALLAQITRHRIASFSVQSQRYVEMDSFEAVVPPSIAENSDALAEFDAAINEDRAHYEKLSEILTFENFKKLMTENNLYESDEKVMDEYKNPSSRKIKDLKLNAKKGANEDARFILPTACATNMIMTMNARELIHFFELRACNRAQWEIRSVAEEMMKLLRECSPLLFAKAGPPCVRSGVCREGKMTCGRMREMREKYL